MIDDDKNNYSEALKESKWAILEKIAQGSKSATEIASEIKTSLPNITQQLKILEAYGLIKKDKSKEGSKGRTAGKPKIRYSLGEENAYIAILSNNITGKKKIPLEGFNKALLNILMIVPEESFFILKFMFKNEEFLKKCKSIAYLRSSREAIELFLLTDHVDEIRAKFSNLFIEDIHGKTKKIINWTHNDFEIREGLNRKDKYFMDMLKHIQIIHDSNDALAILKNLREDIK